MVEVAVEQIITAQILAAKPKTLTSMHRQQSGKISCNLISLLTLLEDCLKLDQIAI
jgi:hypothetical protein